MLTSMTLADDENRLLPCFYNTTGLSKFRYFINIIIFYL